MCTIKDTIQNGTHKIVIFNTTCMFQTTHQSLESCFLIHKWTLLVCQFIHNAVYPIKKKVSWENKTPCSFQHKWNNSSYFLFSTHPCCLLNITFGFKSLQMVNTGHMIQLHHKITDWPTKPHNKHTIWSQILNFIGLLNQLHRVTFSVSWKIKWKWKLSNIM